MSGKEAMARYSKVPAAVAKPAFVAALARGATVAEAAREAGATLFALYRWRGLDPDFDLAWREAAEGSRGWVAKARPGRPYRAVRTKRRVRFAGAARQWYLAVLALTCNSDEAARQAGFHPSTVRRNARRDPAFAAERQAALEQGYARLERLLAAQRATAAARMEEVLDSASDAETPPADDETLERILSRYTRPDGRIAPGCVSPEKRRRRWSFDEAIALLERRLRWMGVEIRETGDEEDDGAEVW
ncbi:MAG: hypothetical protein ACJ8ER_16420 [Allosphingosinicella sp.]